MALEKRYQVFVSSTYQDLIEERKEVMQALLELKCMPAGMELFPAANDDQWTLIKRVIDDSDYYIVIVAGRYGSTNEDGISYTEMEYRYALQAKKPIIAFVHKDIQSIPTRNSEDSAEGKAKLAEFVKLVQKKLVKHWSNPSELGSVVSRSLVNLMNSTPAVGWVKANFEPDETLREKIIQLQSRIAELEALGTAAARKPKDVEDLVQGDDVRHMQVTLAYWSGVTYKHFRVYASISWNAIFAAIGPVMLIEANEHSIRSALHSALVPLVSEEASKLDTTHLKFDKLSIADSEYHTIIIQLRALGLIEQSKKQRSVKDSSVYWSLTPYGDDYLTKLRAIRRTSE